MSKFRFLETARAVPFRIRIALAAVSLSAVALTGVLYTTGSETFNADVFPDHLSVRAELHKGEDLRNVEFWSDGVTPRRSTAFNTDGTTSHYDYRPDGTLQTAETIRTLDNGTKIVVRHADIMPDGATYKYDVQFFDDGVRKAKENRLVDAKTQHRLYYHENGVIRAEQTLLFDGQSLVYNGSNYVRRGWYMDNESVYRADTSLASTYKSLANEGSERRNFSDKGVLVSWMKTGEYKSTYEEAIYQDDGKTLVRKMSQTHQNTSVSTYRPNGSIAETRQWFGPVDTAMMTVDTFDANGVRILTQSYMSASDKYRLYSINTYTADGKDDRRHISYDIGGSATETVYFGDGSTWVNRYFNAEGFLYKETDMKAGSGGGATREYTNADNIRMDIPKEWLVMTKWEAPKQVIPYIPSQGYH